MAITARREIEPAKFGELRRECSCILEFRSTEASSVSLVYLVTYLILASINRFHQS
jgi:hypothetical protein